MSEDNDALSRVTHYTDTNGRLQMYPIDLSVGVKPHIEIQYGRHKDGYDFDGPITKLWKRLKRWLKKDR